MSIGKNLMVLGSILGFGLLCFVAGMEYKNGNSHISLIQIMCGFILLEQVFRIINEGD